MKGVPKDLSTSLPQKLICGVKHVRVICRCCKYPVWTAAGKGLVPDCYICNTCYPLAGADVSSSSWVGGERIYTLGE